MLIYVFQNLVAAAGKQFLRGCASEFFRIAAFIVLGLMMLAVSYVYSRFRPSIERMLGREPASPK